MMRLVLMIAAALGLAACGDKPQEMGGAVRQDTAAFNGTGSPFVASGWKQGDKASWESQMKARNQYGQNDYTRMK